MYQRIVCFRFKPGTDKAAIQAHVAHFQRLAEAIPQIRSYRGGRTVPGDYGAAPAYDSLHCLTFADQEAIQTYFDHPAHQDFIQAHKTIWEYHLNKMGVGVFIAGYARNKHPNSPLLLR